MRHDQKKVEYIQALHSTMNIAELQHILGMVTKTSFILNLPEQTESLCKNLKMTVFIWTKSYEKIFQLSKALISKETTLAYFDPNRLTVLRVDASGKVLETNSLVPVKQR